MSMLTEIFSWWGGNTWGTRVTIWNQGRRVGDDEFGNVYYEQKRGVGPNGKPRRWVIYPNLSEASQISASWHGWMHYTTDVPPTEEAYVPKSWEKPHKMNMTGTKEAYQPTGSLLSAEPKSKSGGEYSAWRPE